MTLVRGVGIIFGHSSPFRLEEMYNWRLEPGLFIPQSCLQPLNSWLVSQSCSCASRWCRLFRDRGSQKHSAPSFEGRQPSQERKTLPEGWPLGSLTAALQEHSTILSTQQLRGFGSRNYYGQDLLCTEVLLS